MGFCVVCDGNHNTSEEIDSTFQGDHANDHIPANTRQEVHEQKYFETPYALLSSLSHGYNLSFGKDLTQKLLNIQR